MLKVQLECLRKKKHITIKHSRSCNQHLIFCQLKCDRNVFTMLSLQFKERKPDQISDILDDIQAQNQSNPERTWEPHPE